MASSENRPDSLEEAQSFSVSSEEKEAKFKNILDLDEVLIDLEDGEKLKESIENFEEFTFEDDGSVNQLIINTPSLQKSAVDTLIIFHKTIDSLEAKIAAGASRKKFPASVLEKDVGLAIGAIYVIRGLITTYATKLESVSDLSAQQQIELKIKSVEDFEVSTDPKNLISFGEKTTTLEQKLNITNTSTEADYFDPREQDNLNPGSSYIDSFREKLLTFEEIYVVEGKPVEKEELIRLRKKYLAPAREVLSLLEERVKKMDDQEFIQWKIDIVTPNITSLNSFLSEPQPTDVADILSLQTSLEAKLADVQAELDSQNLDDKKILYLQEEYLDKAEKRIEELKKAHTLKKFEENSRVVVDFLSDAPDKDMDFSELLAKYSALGEEELNPILTKLKTDLEREWPLFINAIDENPLTKNFLVDLTKKYDSSIILLKKLIKETDGSLKELASNRIETIFAEIVRSESMIKGNTANDARITAPIINNGVETAGIKPLVARFFPKEIEKWDNLLDLTDGMAAGSAIGLDAKQVGWVNFFESRDAAAGHISFMKMRELAFTPEVKPVLEAMEDLFKKPVEYYVVEKDGKFILANRGDVGAKKVKHDYARTGDPDDGQALTGILSTSDYLAQKFPDRKAHVISMVFMISVVGELRLKYYSKYYANYMQSPETTYGAMGPLAVQAPMMRLLYAIRAYGKIPPKLRLLWQILRLPGNKDTSLSENLTRKTTRDKKNHPKSVISEPLNLKHPEYDGEVGEYSLPEAPEKSPGDPDKSNPDTAYHNNQVADAIEVRTWVDESLTFKDKDFTPVRLGEDLVLLPHYWDVIFPDESDPDAGKYNDLGYKQYNDAVGFFEEFLQAAQFPGEMSSMEDVKNIVGGLIRKISPFKGLFYMMPKDTLRGAVFRRVLQELLLRVIKNVHDQYHEKVKFTVKVGKPLTKHLLFLEEVIEEVEGMGTLIPEVKHYIIELLEDYQIDPVTGKLATSHGLFSTAHGNPAKLANTGGATRAGFKERSRRESLIAGMRSEEPPPDESK